MYAQALEPGFPTGPPVAYRLICRQPSDRGRRRDPGDPGSVHEAGLSGTFVLVPQFSPLDWDNYLLDTVRLRSLDAEGDPLPMCGDGFYSVGGRLTFTKQMELRLWTPNGLLQFSGGPDPVDPYWPIIDMTVTGERAGSKASRRGRCESSRCPSFDGSATASSRGVGFSTIARLPPADDTAADPRRASTSRSKQTGPFIDRHRVFDLDDRHR